MKDYVGNRYGRLVVIDNGYPVYKNSDRMVKVKCDCWTEKKLVISTLRANTTRSCGCMKREQMANKKRTHWMYWIRIHRIRSWIKTRCNNNNVLIYKHYWWRWITYDRKRETFEWFYEDMWPTYKEWLEIDRIDNDWNYCKENCKWVIHKDNMQHYRKCHYITYNWETKNISQWAKIKWKHTTTILRRINRWLSIEKILSTKKRIK
jgi:hypothetical protein